MAWTLWETLLGMLTDLEPVKLVIAGVKAALGALGGYLLKRVWRLVMGGKDVDEDRNDGLLLGRCFIKTCLRLPSANPAHRGLCLVCFSKAKKKVESGDTTWDKLAEMGLCKSGGVDPFDDAYSKAMEDK